MDPNVHICGAIRKGKVCWNPAGKNTDHYGYGICAFHGGNMRPLQQSAAKEEAMVTVRRIMGPAIEIEPMEALLMCVKIAAGEVAYATWKIDQIQDDEVLIAETSETVRDATGEKAESYTETTKTNLVQLNIWIVTRQQATDRLARYSKMALDAGVAERQVILAEQAGDTLAVAIRSILDGLSLTAEQEERAPQLVRGALETLEGRVSQELPSGAEQAA